MLEDAETDVPEDSPPVLAEVCFGVTKSNSWVVSGRFFVA